MVIKMNKYQQRAANAKKANKAANKLATYKEYLCKCMIGFNEVLLEQNQLHSTSPINEVGGGYIMINIASLNFNKKVLTSGICNYQLFKGTSNNHSFAGSTKRGALYVANKHSEVCQIVNAKGMKEWLITFEHMNNKSQMVLAVIAKTEPTEKEGIDLFFQFCHSMKDSPAFEFIMETFHEQPLQQFVMTLSQNNIGSIGWVETK
jgi:hypothetical protein